MKRIQAGVESVDYLLNSTSLNDTSWSKNIKYWDEQERQKQLEERRAAVASTIPRRPIYLDGRVDINDGSVVDLIAESHSESKTLEIAQSRRTSSAKLSESDFPVKSEYRVYSPSSQPLQVEQIEADVQNLVKRLDHERRGIQQVCFHF